MAKYYGKIGFATQAETRPGVWEDAIVDRPYKGDVMHSGRRWDQGESINDNVTLTNKFSIISDSYLYSHIPDLRYLTYNKVKFKITSVEIDRPRVTISVGGVYVSGDDED